GNTVRIDLIDLDNPSQPIINLISPQTYTSTAGTQAIPDGSGSLTSDLVITDAMVLSDVNVQLSITHGRLSDLSVALQAPDGTLVQLVPVGGASGANFSNTRFDDQASSALSAGTAPYTGSFRPASPLAALNGKTLKGTWHLIVSDSVAGMAGTLDA